MKRHGTILVAALIAMLFSVLAPQDSSGIPAFARRYKMSCTTCHAPFPRLKPYGDDFAGAGFVIQEEEKDRDYVSAGDDLLWLNRSFPFAVRFDAFAIHDENQDVKNDLQTPWGLKLMSGGTLYKSVGYYFYFYMSERGEVAGIEDAYVHFNDVLGIPMDIMVGQFQTSDPLMKRELRLTVEDYIIYKIYIEDSNINLAYDRGVMIPFTLERTATDLVALVVNGNGKDAAHPTTKRFDSDPHKNVAFRLNQAVGEPVTVGGYYYVGKEDLAGGFTNEVTFWGVDATIAAGAVEFAGQYLLRTDSHPTDAGGGSEVETLGLIAELTFAPQLDKSRFVLTGLFNSVDSDLDQYDYETATVSLTYLLARNLRGIAEYTYDLERESNRFTIGVVSAF